MQGSVVAYQNQILTSNMYKVTLEIIPQRIMSWICSITWFCKFLSGFGLIVENSTVAFDCKQKLSARKKSLWAQPVEDLAAKEESTGSKYLPWLGASFGSP